MIGHVELFSFYHDAESKARKAASVIHYCKLYSGATFRSRDHSSPSPVVGRFLSLARAKILRGCSSSRDLSLNRKFVRVRILNGVFVERYARYYSMMGQMGLDGARSLGAPPGRTSSRRRLDKRKERKAPGEPEKSAALVNKTTKTSRSPRLGRAPRHMLEL